jgi:hypothetical protein
MQKAKLLANDVRSNIDPASNLVTESSVINQIIASDDYESKWNMSQEAQKSPFIVIIDPSDTEADVVAKFEKFRMLNTKNQLWSNQTSLNIWGYTVLNMLQLFKQKEMMADLQIDQDHNINLVTDERVETLENVAESMIYNNDIIGLYTVKLNQYAVSESFELPQSAKDGYLMIDKIVNEALTPDYGEIIPHYTPFFTQDEYNRLSTENLLETLSYEEWKVALREAIADKDDERIINLGWNPVVEFNEENVSYARQRQIRWLEKYAPKIIDIRGISERLEVEEIVTEASKSMKELYSAKNLYPIYIVTSYSNTPFGKVERLIKKVKYSHAGLAVDSNLKEIFTFSFGKGYTGFTTDSISTYYNYSKDAIVDVTCMFVDKETRDQIYSTLNDLNKNRSKTRYGFGNIINILLNRAKHLAYPENLSMVCSQFVDTILKLVGIDITHKPSNLVIPEDFYKVENNPKIYKVYEGKAIEYNEKKIEKDIKFLFMTNSVRNIKYTDPIQVGFGVGEASSILDELTELIKPTAIISKGNSSSLDTLKYSGNTIKKYTEMVENK